MRGGVGLVERWCMKRLQVVNEGKVVDVRREHRWQLKEGHISQEMWLRGEYRCCMSEVRCLVRALKN